MNGFHHEAVFYRDDAEYLAGTVPDIRDAVAGDGSVLVAVGEDKQRLLREALGADAERVAFIDMPRLGRNPACIIPAWREFLGGAGPGPIVGVGEPVWPGRGEAELAECSRHESLLNLAFDGGRAWRLLCPYDAAALEPAVLAQARRNHPHLSSAGDHSPSPDYTQPPAAFTGDVQLPAPTTRPAQVDFGPADLVLVRRFVTERARAAGFAQSRLTDLVLAVNELVANTLRHAGGSGVVRTWTDGDTFLCEVSDGGRIADPLAGRRRPSDLHGTGRGLWIVNQLCDLVQVRGSTAGTVVRLHMRLA